MFGIRRKKAAEFVEPDLPITPMLDMSFQLMAFFIFTFRPAPAEGQIAMSLPKEEGGGVSIPTFAEDDKPVTFVVQVFSSTTGGIANMTIIEQGAAETTPQGLGAGFPAYQAELKKRFAELKGKPGKLTLEIEGSDPAEGKPGVLHEYVVRLLDIASEIGFTDIAPVPMKQ